MEGLTESQREALRELTEKTGVPEEAYLREAVDMLLHRYGGQLCQTCRQPIAEHINGVWCPARRAGGRG